MSDLFSSGRKCNCLNGVTQILGQTQDIRCSICQPEEAKLVEDSISGEGSSVKRENSSGNSESNGGSDGSSGRSVSVMKEV